MKFESFLLNEDRSTKIDLGKALLTIKDNCSKSINSTPIYRGVTGSSTAMFVNPSLFTRTSANTNNNLYTLIIDNSSKWKKYPKRSKSIVCSTDDINSAGYGYLYRVYPYDGADIGVCPKQDIWFSFDKILKRFNFSDMSIFFSTFINPFVKNIDASLAKKLYNENLTYSELKLILSVLDKERLRGPDTLRTLMDDLVVITKYITLFKTYKDKTILEVFEEILDPVKAGFKIVKSGSDLPKNVEVWTDSPSVLISSGFENNIKYEEDDWRKQ